MQAYSILLLNLPDSGRHLLDAVLEDQQACRLATFGACRPYSSFLIFISPIVLHPLDRGIEPTLLIPYLSDFRYVDTM